MNKTVISEGIIRLTGNGGVKDKRNNRVYSEYIGEEKNEIFFEDAVIEEPVVTPTKRGRKKTSA